MSGCYPAGLTGSDPYFNPPDCEEPQCFDCKWRADVMINDDFFEHCCTVALDGDGTVDLIHGTDDACGCFERRWND